MQVFLSDIFVNETALEITDVNLYRFLRLIYIAKFYWTPFFAVLGIFLNILAIIIAYRCAIRKSSILPYLVTLAICDTLFLCMVILEWVKYANYYGYDIYRTEGFCQAMTYITSLCVFTSTWLTFCIHLDRYFYNFTNPRTLKYMCTKLKAKFITAAILAIGVVVYLNICLLYAVHIDLHFYLPTCTPLNNFKTAVDMFTKIEFVLNLGVPCIGIVVLIMLFIIRILMKKLREWKLNKNNSTTDTNENQNITSSINNGNGASSNHTGINHNHRSPQRTDCGPSLKVLSLSTSVYFSVFTMPLLVVNVVITIFSEPGYWQYMTLQLALTQQFLHFIFYCRFSLNFVVYFLTDKSFRQALLKLLLGIFCCRMCLFRKGRKSQMSQNGNSSRSVIEENPTVMDKLLKSNNTNNVVDV